MLKAILLSGSFALSAMFAPSAAAIICCVSHYSETGDAGDEHSAQDTGLTLTVGDPLDIIEINGALGGTDTTDAFKFHVGVPLNLSVNASIGAAVLITLEL